MLVNSRDISKYSPHLQSEDVSIGRMVAARSNRGDVVVRAKVTGIKPGKVLLLSVSQVCIVPLS